MRATECDAVLFDVDDVLTETAAVHEQAWEELFNEVIRVLAPDERAVAPYEIADYLRYLRRIDGQPRTEGIRAVLEARRVHLPIGSPADDERLLTVHGLANRENQTFLRLVREQALHRYSDLAHVLTWLTIHDIRTVVVSTLPNADIVLRAIELRDAVDVLVDGVATALLSLPRDPSPAPYLFAARQLHADPGRTIVVADATRAIASARGGGFWIVGVGRSVGCDVLVESGADRVVGSFRDVFADERQRSTPEPEVSVAEAAS